MSVKQGYYKKVCVNTPNKNPIQDIKKHITTTSYFDILGGFCGVCGKYTALHKRAIKTQNKASV